MLIPTPIYRFYVNTQRTEKKDTKQIPMAADKAAVLCLFSTLILTACPPCPQLHPQPWGLCW